MKKITDQLKQYIIDSIDGENYDLDLAVLDDAEKIAFFFDVFNNEYNFPFDKILYPRLDERIEKYLRGLPSCIHVAFSDYDIRETLNSLGYVPTIAAVESWWRLCATALLEVASGNGIGAIARYA